MLRAILVSLAALVMVAVLARSCGLTPEQIESRVLLADLNAEEGAAYRSANRGRPGVVELPDGLAPETLLEKVLGPALARLRLEFPSRAAYQEFWHEHPAFAEPAAWNRHVEAYFDYDLIGEPPHLRSRVVEQAVRTDGLDPMRADMITMIDRVPLPMLMLTAVRGLLNQPDPLLPVAAVKAKVDAIPHLSWQEIPDTNHYSITLGHGASAVAKAITGFAR